MECQKNQGQGNWSSFSQHVPNCQDQFFTDLISMRGLGVRGWPSGKTEMLHSVVALPE